MLSDITNAFQIILETGLFWDEMGHVLLEVLVSMLIWKKTKRRDLALIPLVFTFIPDVDHLFDYFGFYGFGFSASKFVTMDYFYGPGRAFIPLHAYEWALILLPFSIKKGWKSKITAINLGYFAHLVWDTITVGNILFYSIIYRYLIGFRLFFN